MRVALISDIHAHAAALRLVLDDIDRRGADRIACLGDLATLGPEPAATLDMLAHAGCRSVAGNHDLALVEPARAIEFGVDPSLVSALEWCEKLLAPRHVKQIRACEPELRYELAPGIDLLCLHGSALSVSDQILATTPAAELERMLGGRRASVIAVGHTHLQMVRQYDGMTILNPGSVGSPFHEAFHPGIVPRALARADYALVSADRGVMSVEVVQVPLDVELSLKVLRASTLPTRDWWIAQYSVPAAPSATDEAGNGQAD